MKVHHGMCTYRATWNASTPVNLCIPGTDCQRMWQHNFEILMVGARLEMTVAVGVDPEATKDTLTRMSRMMTTDPNSENAVQVGHGGRPKARPRHRLPDLG